MSSATYQTPPELAPSEMTDDQASWPRTVGLTGFMAVALGVLILILNGVDSKLAMQFGNNVGFAAIVLGMVFMLFHAARDTDQLIRRLYGTVGGLGLPLAGIILSVMPVIISATKALSEGETRKIVSLFFPFGWTCFFSGLFFLIIFCKNETEEGSRKTGLYALAGFGIAFALTGFVLGNIINGFILTYGSVLVLLGLVYLSAYVSQVGGADLEGYKPAIGIGLLGGLVFLVALARTLIPHETPYFIPGGLLLMTLGAGYAAVSLFMVSDWQLIVLTRRELAAYFYSPIAYLVLIINVVVAGINYHYFTEQLNRQPMLEPILGPFMFSSIFWAFVVVFMVPALTMRMISEEKRSGTYEVLMCAPVSEITVLLSKLLSGVIFYLMTWGVWGIFLLALRAESGMAFEYRPILSFVLALTISGFTLISMGLFFSCLTKNQIIAAGLTFFGMLFYVGLLFAAKEATPESPAQAIFKHLTFFSLWFESIEGRINLRDMVLQFSITFFWFFLSLKVLQARRWG
ncbi:ABC transporter permease [Zavarzinella formosa]|uniref:ABC transporter permease n=1 Tax=Zavarzinella formosa TaxID=360055 RepID=UPI0002F3D77C|nr:ABC transporter permease [Zavarzinella formosa]